MWKAENQTVSLTIFAAPITRSAPALLDRQSRFLHSLKSKAQFKISDYATSAGVSERQARRDLAALEKQGVLKREGSGPATCYLFHGLPS
jgi:predicted ArsR family transcriptional regulator